MERDTEERMQGGSRLMGSGGFREGGDSGHALESGIFLPTAKRHSV